KRRVLAKLKSLASNRLFNNSFFQIQRHLLEARVNFAAFEETFTGLHTALSASEKIHTLYQRCEILIELAKGTIERTPNMEGAQFAKRALRLARRNGYRLLGARALLLLGKSAEVTVQKQRYLYSAFQEASEMGLRELIAESAFEIGVFQM